MRRRILLLWIALAIVVSLLALGAVTGASSALQPGPTPRATPSETPLPTPTPVLLIGSTTEITAMSFLLVLLVLIPAMLFRRSWAEKK